MLNVFAAPNAIAVFGASNDPNKIGGRPIAFLKKAGYGGIIVPINPNAQSVQGLPAFPDLNAAAIDVDLAIIALPARFVLPAVRACAAQGVKAATIFSSDVAEEDLMGALSAARGAGMRILGPNSLGSFSTGGGVFATFATALDGAWPKQGEIAIVSQSGAFGSYLYALMDRAGGGLSHVLATGNELDLTVADLVGMLAGDRNTKVIVIALEGVRQGAELMTAVAHARRTGKSVIAMKTGRSAAGRIAAATHTGALAGEGAVFDAALRQSGALIARNLDEAADYARILVRRPRMAGCDLGIVTTSGGIGVLLSDYAEDVGLRVRAMPEPAQKKIKDILPFADGANPIDSSAQILSDMSLFGQMLEIVIEEGGYDALVVFLAHIGRNDAHFAAVAPGLLAARRAHPDLPIIVSMVATEANKIRLEDAGIPVFEDPERAVRAATALRASPAEQLPAQSKLPDVEAPEARLNESAAADWLTSAGVPMAAQRHVTHKDSAIRAANDLGFPLVLKVSSPDILHKSDVGGVCVGLTSPEAVAAAFSSVIKRAEDAVRDAKIDGAILAEMVADGPELILGTTIDPDFGPVVMVGTGGIQAELYKDVVFRTAPISPGEAMAMLDDLEGSALLNGFRGGPVADRNAVGAVISRVSHLADHFREIGLRIEINPLRIVDGQPIGLDAVIQTDRPLMT